MSRFSIVKGISHAFYVVSGNAARDKAKKEREERERRQAQWEAERARQQAEREAKEKAERERREAAAREREEKYKAEQEQKNREYAELVDKFLKDIYRNRYIILACTMMDVLVATYQKFKIEVLAQEPLLSDEDIGKMFRVAFPHTELAHDWKAGTLRTGQEGMVRNDDLPPQPLWVLEGKDPHGYWKGAKTFPDAFIERLENFLTSHPDWYMRNLLPPIADSENVNLSAAVRWYQRKAEEAQARLADNR